MSISFAFLGGELFAKRKKRADKWVVDDEHVCDSQPDKVADKFVREQARMQERIIQVRRKSQHLGLVYTTG